MRACETETIHAGANANPDTLVVLPMSAGLTDGIQWEPKEIVKKGVSSAFSNAFWSKDTSDEYSVIIFPCECKGDDSTRNRNQLMMDFGVAQSQRRALGLDPAIIWGSTCTKGRFEVFSSEWVNDTIAYSSHYRWNLLEPVDIMKCYSFLCNLACATATLQRDLEGMNKKIIARSVISAPWRALTLPSARLGKRKRFHNGGHDGAGDAPMGGKISDGVDDLEPEESAQWNESVKTWQLDHQRPEFEASTFCLPLKRHLVELQPKLVYDRERIRSGVDEWRRSSIQSKSISPSVSILPLLLKT